MEANGAGTIEGIADDPEALEALVPGAGIIEGTSGQLSLAVGGRKPDQSRLSLRSIEVDVDGQYEKGTTVEFRVVARVDKVSFVDTHDEYGTVTATKRVHSAKPISVTKIDA